MQSHNTITVAGFKKAADPSVEVTIPRELGPVRLLHEIGRGGMGVVYLGRHRMLDRDVAVKFLLHAVAGPDDPGFAGFLEGTRAAAAVQHPGLTTIHHADVVDGIPYLVMQYIDGPTLGDVLKQTGPLNSSALFAVLDAVSEAIGELHDREIVHRDIKPANILLDRKGRVFVTDFGLACSRPRAQRGQASTGLAGTPSYMAPEMFDGEVSLRSDVYALGITCFELLTGKLPFGGTLDEVREKHIHQALPVELLQEQDVDAELIEVIERATHKDAMYRYKTARHFGAALKSGVATEEVLKDGASELHRVVARSLHKGSDATTPETVEKTPTSTYFARLSEIAGEKRATRELLDIGHAHKPTQDDRAQADPIPDVRAVASEGGGSLRTARTVTDVHFPGKVTGGYGLILLYCVIGFFVAIAVACGLGGSPGEHWAGRLGAMWGASLSAICGGAVVAAAVLFTRRTARARIRTLTATGATDDLVPLTHALLSHTSRQVLDCGGISLFLRTLVSQGRVGETIRICPQKQTTPIEPLTFPFEPVPLDESDASFDELYRALGTDADHSGPENRPAQTPSASLLGVRRVRRNWILRGGGWFLLGVLTLIVVGSAWDAFAGQPLTWKSVLCAGALAYYLLVPARSGSAWRKQHLAVPGGLIVRKARWQRGTWKVHLFDSRDSVLCVHRAAKHKWRLTVADAETCESAEATKREIDLLLRAWLSPLPPP
ncbi:MAG: serine/threonine protein kinase, partial [Planctomycetes bacterium]|nr:serine/threonine protein kinase [Planctomycetota bacterium]